MNNIVHKNLNPYVADLHSNKVFDELSGNVIRLSLSESPYGMSLEVKEYLKKEINKVNFYPDSNCEELREIIGLTYGITKDMSIVGNGADELLLLTSLAFLNVGDFAITTNNTFSGYNAAVNIVGGTLIEVNLNKYKIDINVLIKNIRVNYPKVVFICNPHNPTGTYLKEEELNALVEVCEKTKTLLVVDEAYNEYVDEKKHYTAIKYVKQNKRVIVLRTFSKIYGLAGLRCGYAIANQDIIEEMMKLRNALPFNVNRLALKAATVSLQNQEFIKNVKELNSEVRTFLYKQLNSLGFKTVESQTNFLLIDIKQSSSVFCKKLFDDYKIIVRDAEAFGFNNHIRLSFEKLETMKFVIKCIKKTANTDKMKVSY